MKIKNQKPKIRDKEHKPKNIKINTPRCFLYLLFYFLFFILSGTAHAHLSELAINPLLLEMGSRPLGMGGAFAGIDDLNSTLYNPGGLAWAKGVSFSIRDMNNISALQAYPLGGGSSLGLAVITSKISDIPIQGGTARSASNVVYLSYGTKLSFLPALYESPALQRVAVGLNIKGLMGQGLQRTGEPDNSATGWDVDAGVLWKATEWWRAGLSLQNFLPAGILGTGGIIKWNVGDAEGIPARLRLAGSAQVIGDIHSPVYMEERKLLLSGEIDFSMRQPTLLRIGSEWEFKKNFLLRTGFMQQHKVGGIASDINLGLGYRSGEWGVDVAYYREPVRDQRYTLFSVLYFPKEWVVIRKLNVKKPALMIERAFESISLADNVVAYADKIDVFGKVKPGVKVNINGLPVSIDEENNFRVVVPLRLQKNFVVVEALYEGERKIWKYKVLRKAKVRVAKEAGVEAEKKEKVEILATMGVIEVTPEADFVMEAGVTRGELTTWIVKAADINLPVVSKNLFVDVPKEHPLAPYVKIAMDLNLLSPYPDGTFRPEAIVTKAEGEAIFARFGVTR